MKKSVLTLLLFSLCLGFISGQEEKSLLWEISGKNLEQPSYLFGTVHLICPDDFQMDESVINAFGKSELIYLELDFDDPEMMAEMQNRMFLADGKSAKDFINETDYNKIDGFLKSETGMRMMQVEKVKPFALMSLMIIPLTGCEPISFEREFTQMAGETKMEIIGFETVAYQMSLFDSIPFQMQYNILIDMADKKEEICLDFKKMIDAYKEKDLSKLAELMDESDWEFKGYENLLNYNRNKNWIPLIEKTINEKPIFIAVGAGHLPGDKGLIKLLQDKGYKVKPVL